MADMAIDLHRGKRPEWHCHPRARYRGWRGMSPAEAQNVHTKRRACRSAPACRPTRSIIVPVIFCTVVHGIASMSNLKAVGSTGIKALVYFEVVTTLALIVGLVVANVIRPGDGMNVDRSTTVRETAITTTSTTLSTIPDMFGNNVQIFEPS